MKVETALRMSFRKFTLLKRNVEIQILHDIMDFDIDQRATQNILTTKIRWERRLGKKLYHENLEEALTTLKEETQKKPLRILPKELQQLLNLTTAWCTQCKK